MQQPLSRREILGVWGAAVASAALMPRALGAQAEPSSEKPNVLFIAVDDLNDWIGCLGGHPDTKTPNLDRLAERGVLFTNAFCAAPACNPSRAALMTGIRPSTSGVYNNNQPWRPVMPDVTTLPQHFMAHEYRVVGGGKIYHGGFPDPQVLPWESVKPPSFRWFSKRATFRWILRSLFRFKRRLLFAAELGWPEGGKIPLSLGLLGVARRPEE